MIAPRAPWPTRLEWRAVRDRVRLIAIVTDDRGEHARSVADFSTAEAEVLLSVSMQHQLLTAIATASWGAKPANDVA